jgi:serine-type D-Ala-D-Ala carboxypeptidase/endopeptidase (penicillin-binding protein 4)
MKTFLTLFCSLIFLLLSYAPAGNSISAENKIEPPVTELPQRPEEANEHVKNRELLVKNDSRISYCEILENQSATYTGYHDNQMLPLASLSKVLTSAWAMALWGPDFRFQSEFYLNPVEGEPGVYDAYLKTNYDPVVNIEKILFYLSELNQAGVKQLRNLVIDESTRVYLSVTAGPHLELEQVPVSTKDSIENLKLILNSNNWAEKTKQAKDHLEIWAKEKKKSLKIPTQFSVDKVSYLPAEQIKKSSYKFKKIISSSPLLTYLKNLNTYSNNYISDALFNQLGGSEKFQNFQKQELKLKKDELQVFTGSGLPLTTNGLRRDNLGTCFSMIKVLSFFKSMADKNQLNLGYLLLNPSSDTDGTLDYSVDYKNAVVVKTGRLYEVPAMNLAGFVSTQKGIMSFVFLGHDFSDDEAKEIEALRQAMVFDIFSNFKTDSTFLTSIDFDIFL